MFLLVMVLNHDNKFLFLSPGANGSIGTPDIWVLSKVFNHRATWDTNLVSISPIFYEQLFHINVFCAAFVCLQFGFVIFWQKDLGAKAAHQMLVKLTPILSVSTDLTPTRTEILIAPCNKFWLGNCSREWPLGRLVANRRVTVTADHSDLSSLSEVKIAD